ncbi:MAG: ferrochelatase, partial [Alphaproteobacteria bacterium]|nr:ferrochelatase [Alphaproteobacteria bacterium]
DRAALAVPSAAICCYPREPGFIAALAELTGAALSELPPGPLPRILFSAHGLPKKIVRSGDPYVWQVEATVAELRAALARPELESVVCYQSRVGPLAWVGPSTDAEIRRAAADGRAILVVPVAFVSEHSETLVELDIEYRHAAARAGAVDYRRVPTVGTHPAFIAGLAALVRGATHRADRIASAMGTRICPARCGSCPLVQAAARCAT